MRGFVRGLRDLWLPGVAVFLLGAAASAQAIDVQVVFDRGGGVLAHEDDVVRTEGFAPGDRFGWGQGFRADARIGNTWAWTTGRIDPVLPSTHTTLRFAATALVADVPTGRDPAAATTPDRSAPGPLSFVVELRGVPGVLVLDVTAWTRELGGGHAKLTLDVDDDGSRELVVSGEQRVERLLKVPSFAGLRRVRVEADVRADGRAMWPAADLYLAVYHDRMPLQVTRNGAPCGVDVVLTESGTQYHILQVRTVGAPAGFAVLAIGEHEALFRMPSSTCDLLLEPWFALMMIPFGGEFLVTPTLETPARGAFRMQVVVLETPAWRLWASPRLDLRAIDP